MSKNRERCEWEMNHSSASSFSESDYNKFINICVYRTCTCMYSRGLIDWLYVQFSGINFCCRLSLVRLWSSSCRPSRSESRTSRTLTRLRRSLWSGWSWWKGASQGKLAIPRKKNTFFCIGSGTYWHLFHHVHYTAAEWRHDMIMTAAVW